MGITGAFCTTYAYTPEVYPTSVRTTGLGVASAFARVAGILTPYIAKSLGEWHFWLPIVIYSSTCFLASFASLGLPLETSKRELTDVVATQPLLQVKTKQNFVKLEDENN